MNDRESLNPEKYILVITTTNSPKEAENLAEVLVKQKIAACVSISSPVLSVYRWKDNLEREQEFMLFIKTVAERYRQVETLIQQHHSYDLPEIMAVPAADIEKTYGEWIYNSTRIS
jgi:periplasmic divalent cation tolerance protein